MKEYICEHDTEKLYFDSWIRIEVVNSRTDVDKHVCCSSWFSCHA